MYVFVLQMFPFKKSATKKSSKRQRTSSNSFWSDDVNMAFNDHYKRAPIILERTVDLRVFRRHFHSGSVQGKDMFKVVEPNGQGLWRNHSRILCQCHCGKGSHKLLAKREKVLCHKGDNSRDTGGSSNDSTHIPTYDERREKLGPIVEVFGGKINKKALHTIPFTPEMRTLAYIMIFNLYPVRNLTNLSALRSIFLSDLFTHKEIDICSHIYHLFTKCITKWNSRLTLLAAIARVEVHAVLASLAISVKKGEIVLRGSIAWGGEQFSTP